MSKKTMSAVPNREFNPKDSFWGPGPWPSAKYMDFLMSRGVPAPPMSEADYHVAAAEKKDLATRAHHAEKVWREVSDTHASIERMLTHGDISPAERPDLEKQLADLDEIKRVAKTQYDHLSAQHVAAVKRLLPTVEWLDKYRPFPSRWARASRLAGTKTLPNRLLFRGALYRLAAPQLGPEYYIEVSADDLDPEQVMSFHSGQWDPVYALGSRLVAYGKTLASEEELEALIDTVERLFDTIEDTSDRVGADELLRSAYRLLGRD